MNTTSTARCLFCGQAQPRTFPVPNVCADCIAAGLALLRRYPPAQAPLSHAGPLPINCSPTSSQPAPDTGQAMPDQGTPNVELLRESHDLAAVERQYVEMGERYYRERQDCVNMATIAGRIILRFHTAAHDGPVKSCPSCSADWAFIGAGSGVTAPAA